MLYPTSSRPAEVIGAVDAHLAPLAQRLWAAVGDDDLLEAILALEEHEAHLGGLRARMLAEIAARELARKQLSWASTGEWYAHLAGITRAAGQRAILHAKALVGERRETLTAMSDGRVSGVQAATICDAIDKLPTSPSVRAEAEERLIDEASRLDATQLAEAGRRIVEVVDADGAERRAEAALSREERAAHLGRNLSITDDGAGGVRVRGRGSTEDAAVLRAALIALTKPAPALDPDDPTRSALRDPRDHGTRMWDALIGIAQSSLTHDLQPESHGARPRLSVLIDWESLKRDTAQAAFTDDGLRLSHATVRRLACDADIIAVRVGADHQPLDVGRTHRLVTPALWSALIVRDRHCAFPGCTRPPVMCHGHHIRHWAQGGPTDLDNLVMLCGHHHRTVHDTAWEVRLAPDGRPEFLPPPRRQDRPPPPTWIRDRPRRE